MADLTEILADLAAEGQALDDLVTPLPEKTWAAPTPAEGWTIAHQIAHLTWTDDQALIAATRPDDFGAVVERAVASGGASVDEEAAVLAARPPGALLARWRQGRIALSDALAGLRPGTRLPWFGVSMSVASMVNSS